MTSLKRMLPASPIALVGTETPLRMFYTLRACPPRLPHHPSDADSEA